MVSCILSIAGSNNKIMAVSKIEYWRLDLAEVWRKMPYKGLFLGLLGAWVVLFHFLGNSTLGYVNTPSLFGWWFWTLVQGAGVVEGQGLSIVQVLSSEEGFAFVIPWIVACLLWWKRSELVALPKRIWWPALALFFLALLLHLLGYMVQQTRFSFVAFFVGIYAMTGLVWGWPWLRVTLFPFFLFAFCVPLGNSAEMITFPLRLLATKITVLLCHGLDIGVLREGNRVLDPLGKFQYEVAAECSGIRSLTMMFALATIYGFVSFQANWKRLLIILAAFPLAVIGNVLRLTIIILAAEAGGKASGDWVHQNSLFSLLPYVPAIAGILALGYWLEVKRKPKEKNP